jgi:hypothetical protein
VSPNVTERALGTPFGSRMRPMMSREFGPLLRNQLRMTVPSFATAAEREVVMIVDCTDPEPSSLNWDPSGTWAAPGATTPRG